MKRNLITTVLLIVTVISVKSHPVLNDINPELYTRSDSASAAGYMQEANELFNKADYDSAIVYLDKAAVIYEEHEDWESLISCLNRKGSCYNQAGKYPEAIDVFTETKYLILEIFGDNNIYLVRILTSLSSAYWGLGDFKLSRESITESVELGKNYEQETDPDILVIVSTANHQLGFLNFAESRYDESRANIEKALELIVAYEDQLPQKVASTYNSLAIVNTETGYIDEALIYYEKSLELYIKVLGENHPFIAAIYGNISRLLSSAKGDYDAALAYANRGLPIVLEHYGDAHLKVANAYINLGLIYYMKGNLDEALTNYEKALNSFIAAFKSEDRPEIGMVYNYIGEVYVKKAEYMKALDYYEKAVDMYVKVFGDKHGEVAKLYNDIGTVHRIQGKYEEALKYHEDALVILKDTYGEWNIAVAETYNLFGLAYRDMGQYDISLRQFQKSMLANVPSFSGEELENNPPLDEIISEPMLLETLVYKAETFNDWYYEENKNLNILETAYDTYNAAADLIDMMRTGQKAEGSKLLLAEKSADVYEKAIRLSMNLFDLSGENQYKEKAYSFNEKSKASILQDAINESKAINFSGIPEDLLKREKQLKTDLAFYEIKLQEAKYKKGDKDSTRISDLEVRLFNLDLEYRQFIEELEINYPKYFSSKYYNKPVKIKDVQDQLESNEALLEYFTGSESIFMFCFSKDNYELISVEIDDGFNDLVKSYYSSIKKIGMDEYRQSAAKLYTTILKPAEKFLSDKDKLIIIPDGQLHYAPMEALITKSNDDKDFSKQNYLINTFDVSYHYSTSFLVNAPNEVIAGNENTGLIGFAPVFRNVPDAELLLAHEARSIDNSEDGYRFLSDSETIRELPYSEDELNYIVDLFQRNNKPVNGLFDDNASKENFNSMAGDYNYIHLATHSFVNSDNPQFSGIVLSPPKDTLKSGSTLYSNEIYNLDLNADLVVLSSCESGIGRLVRGEGMMALTRGFLYAGTDNIITSLWKVYDKSTSELMKSFYTNVLDNNSYSSALRKAKLEMIKNNRTAFPANWSGFVLIGK